MTDDKKNQWIEDVAEEELAEEELVEEDSVQEQGLELRQGRGRPIAYIRPVSRQEIEGALPPNAPDGPYFALHDEEGRPLAVFSDADSAWAAARANNLQTVSIH